MRVELSADVLLWLALITTLAYLGMTAWEIVRYQRRRRNRFEQMREQRNDATRLARSFSEPAAKGFEAKRRAELQVVVKTGSQQ